jgi:hypothetical protein
VEKKEALETCALVSEFTDSIECEIDDFLANCVVATCVVVCCIFLACDELFWVEELAVCACSDFVDNCWFKIDENCTWDMLAGACF